MAPLLLIAVLALLAPASTRLQCGQIRVALTPTSSTRPSTDQQGWPVNVGTWRRQTLLNMEQVAWTCRDDAGHGFWACECADGSGMHYLGKGQL